MSENIWFTSDTHAWHNRILDFCRNTRRGESAEEMTELIIDQWNSQVGKNDRVYHTGDFSFGGKDKVLDFASRLNGKIHLVLGNHDSMIKKNVEISSYFESVQHYKTLKVNEHRFILFHFPLAEWWDCHKGTIHLHGHVHGGKDNIQYQQKFKIMDIGIDSRNDDKMALFHIDEVLSFVKDKEIMTHHGD